MAFLAAWPLILHGGREGRRETESKTEILPQKKKERLFIRSSGSPAYRPPSVRPVPPSTRLSPKRLGRE